VSDQPIEPAGEGRHVGDLSMVEARGVQHWDGSLQGPGRWVTLEAPLGEVVGVLFTDDRDRLGFLPVPPNRNPHAPAFTNTITDALRRARYAGAKASDVFGWWAGQASVAVAAQPRIESGSLEDLRPLV
jgi:hypothetical protein